MLISDLIISNSIGRAQHTMGPLNFKQIFYNRVFMWKTIAKIYNIGSAYLAKKLLFEPSDKVLFFNLQCITTQRKLKGEAISQLSQV